MHDALRIAIAAARAPPSGTRERSARRLAAPARRGAGDVQHSVVVEQEDAERRRVAQRAAQLSRIVSNTGCRVGAELLMTRRISAVAVCCSSALACVSLNSRTFSIAITAWSAKVSSSAICLSVNGRGSGAQSDDRADRRRLRASSAPRAARDATAAAARSRAGTRRRRATSGMWTSGARADRGPATDCRDRGAEQRSHQAIDARGPRWRDRSMDRPRPRAEARTVVRAATGARRSRAIASNTGCMSVGELLITRRISRGRGLLLERLLGLVEQAHVLDRDHRLVGERLEQRDLLVVERPGLTRQTRSRRSRVLPAAAAPRARAMSDADAAGRGPPRTRPRRDHQVIGRCDDLPLEHRPPGRPLPPA